MASGYSWEVDATPGKGLSSFLDPFSESLLAFSEPGSSWEVEGEAQNSHLSLYQKATPSQVSPEHIFY